MTKEQFAVQLAKEMRAVGMKINADNAERLIIALSQSMQDGLARDRKLIVSNFGSFEVVKYGAKMIKSPRGDDKKFFMPPTDVIKWHPSGKIRQRATSEEVGEDEYSLLVGNPQEETEPKVIFEQPVVAAQPISAVAANTDPYSVKVNFVGKNKSYLSDECSPISKFVKSIFGLMKSLNADKLEIVPGRLQTNLVYYSGKDNKSQRSLPKDSHSVVVQKIEALAGPANELLLFGTDKIKLSRQLTPFGDQLIITKV
ncbi:MAG: HU family DNA-binding protein [Candidatus Berkelbacteria bacterium]